MQPQTEWLAYQKRGYGITQVVECLPCKNKALSSNPSPTKKERKEVILEDMKWRKRKKKKK
jgi:hypothetical protein